MVKEGKWRRGKKPASEETCLCAKWRGHATAEARMAPRKGIHLNSTKTSGRVDLEPLPHRSVSGQTARCEDRRGQIEA